MNGQPGGLLPDAAGKVIGVVALDIAAGQIQAVSSVVNPDKLAHVGPVGDLRALLAGPRARGSGGDRPL